MTNELESVLWRLVAKANPYESKYGNYSGPDLEAGGTSINQKETQALRDIIVPTLKKGDTIIDYGAGKYARNADYLRGLGYKVYAYDPFNGKPVDGYKLGQVSDTLPSKRFKVGFTSYVLNVVQDSVEKKIISELQRIAKTSYHIVRNDVVAALQTAIRKQNSVLLNFVKEYYPSRKMLTALKNDPDSITKEMVGDLAMFGYESTRGFQKQPMLEKRGFSLLKKTGGWKLYRG